MKIPLLEYFATVSAKEFPLLKFGDSYNAPQEESGKGPASESSAKKKGRTVVITTEDMQKRRNDVKTFDGNEATKKTKKNQLKQQYGNFKAEGSETLEQTFSKLQAIVSHLEFMDVEIEQDDLNQKFGTSLAPEWLMYTIVWRNRDDLDTMSLDDVYNHLKVYEPKVQKKSDSNSQNMAFISSSNTSSGKGKVHTASDITQIDEDDIKEIDIKWNMALLSMRADRFWKKTCKKITVQGSDVAGFDKSKSYMANEEENHALVADDEALTEFALMAKSSLSFENKVYDGSYCSKSCRKNTENLNTKISKLNEELSDCENNLYHYKLGLPKFVDDIVTDYSRPLPSIDTSSSNSSDLQSSNVYVSELGESSSSIMSKPMIKFLKAADFLGVIKTNKTKTARKSPVKYAKMYRNTSKSPKVRGNQRNWKNLKSQQLGKDFLMQNKACFKCGRFDHLAFECGVWVEKGKTWPKNNFAHKNEVERDDDKDDEEEGRDDDQEYDEEYVEETRDEESFHPISKTTENNDDECNGNKDLGLNVGGEEGHIKEEEEDELYKDVNINQGRELQTTLEVEDSHVTLTLVIPDGQQQSSSVSSQFVTSMLNPTLDVEKLSLKRDVEMMMMIRIKNPPLDQTEGLRREGKEPESSSAPTETATRSAGRSTQGSRSRQASASEFDLAEEPMQTTFQME
nr:hypothetical protein [Tanacetum cinerariifolium]